MREHVPARFVFVGEHVPNLCDLSSACREMEGLTQNTLDRNSAGWRWLSVHKGKDSAVLKSVIDEDLHS